MTDYPPENVKKWNREHPTIEQLRAELEQAKAENGRLDNIVQIQQKQVERLLADRDAVKAENARLEAALNHVYLLADSDTQIPWDDLFERIRFTCREGLKETIALHDLLTPTIACLKEVREACAACARAIVRRGILETFEEEAHAVGVKPGFGVRAQEEIARLEAIIKPNP